MKLEIGPCSEIVRSRWLGLILKGVLSNMDVDVRNPLAAFRRLEFPIVIIRH